MAEDEREEKLNWCHRFERVTKNLTSSDNELNSLKITHSDYMTAYRKLENDLENSTKMNEELT